MKNSVFLVFPNQLFADFQILKKADEVILIEEYLFFRQFRFH